MCRKIPKTLHQAPNLLGSPKINSKCSSYMSPQKQEQSKNQNLPRCFFSRQNLLFFWQKSWEIFGMFFLLQIPVILLFKKKNHQISDIKKLGKKNILHRTDPRKSINWKLYYQKERKGKKKQKAHWVLEHPYSDVRGRSANMTDCFIAFPTRPTEGLGRFFYCSS